MNGHFSVINKRGAVVGIVLLLLNIVLFSLSLSKLLGGASKLWLVPVVIFVILFIISVMILVSVLTAGIDVKENVVILPDLDASKGKQPKFELSELQDVQLQNGEGTVLDPYKDSLIGARFVFLLCDGRKEIYYPVSVTCKQYEKIKTGMLKGLSC